jgi:hypothetical protein
VILASFSRGKLIREASLTRADMDEAAKCRRDHNRLGFAYQIGFVRLFSRFPTQQPLEICDELLTFIAVQMNIAAELLSHYAPLAAHRFGTSDPHSTIPALAAL